MSQAATEKLENLIRDNVVPLATEGVRIRVRKQGQLKADVRVGKTYRYYDLASLTKIIFTNTALMNLHQHEQLKLNENLGSTLFWYKYRNIIVQNLLNHSAGLTWWKPIYQYLQKFSKNPTQPNKNVVWEELKEILNSERPNRPGKSVYSDLDYFLLGYLLEQKYQKPLLNIWMELQKDFKLSPDLHFNALNKPKFKRALYAPTERCPWRKKVLRGEVHDDNTWALGGVSSHAGLFGSIDGVDQWLQTLRASYLGKGPLRKSTVEKFWKRSISSNKGDWALGYMMPSQKSSSGKYFSKLSVGHTGFTGTSVWYDPKQDFSVIILSNRVHPTRANIEFISKRPLIHDWCYELFY